MMCLQVYTGHLQEILLNCKEIFKTRKQRRRFFVCSVKKLAAYLCQILREPYFIRKTFL